MRVYVCERAPLMVSHANNLALRIFGEFVLDFA
jgi:hypothetical protein